MIMGNCRNTIKQFMDWKTQQDSGTSKGKVTSLDNGVFYWRNDRQVAGKICLYLDEFFWVGNSIFKKSVVDRISEMFLIGSSASKAFIYIGLSIEEHSDGTTQVDQFDFANTLKPIEISHQRSSNKLSELSEKETRECRSIFGQLN